MDGKWPHILDELVPEAQSHIARRLGLPDPSTIAVAPTTHELVGRILSCLPSPLEILTTGSEFHSAARRFRRLEEAGLASIERVPAEPFATLASRLADAAARRRYDLVFFSQVFFDSAAALTDAGIAEAAGAVRDQDAFVVVDGYHAYMARPVDLGAVAERVFFLGGGYKYAMAGEGACFVHCPPGYGARPLDTGWFAGFEGLTSGAALSYPADGRRFFGATLDATPWYRAVAVQRWLDAEGVDVEAIHAHAGRLATRFVALLSELELAALPASGAATPMGEAPHGNFVVVRSPDAAGVVERLAAAGVVVDSRRDLVRFGFGVYHDEADLDALAGRLRRVLE